MHSHSKVLRLSTSYVLLGEYDPTHNTSESPLSSLIRESINVCVINEWDVTILAQGHPESLANPNTFYRWRVGEKGEKPVTGSRISDLASVSCFPQLLCTLSEGSTGALPHLPSCSISNTILTRWLLVTCEFFTHEKHFNNQQSDCYHFSVIQHSPSVHSQHMTL
jgi:hypothetical protein